MNAKLLNKTFQELNLSELNCKDKLIINTFKKINKFQDLTIVPGGITNFKKMPISIIKFALEQIKHSALDYTDIYVKWNKTPYIIEIAPIDIDDKITEVDFIPISLNDYINQYGGFENIEEYILKNKESVEEWSKFHLKIARILPPQRSRWGRNCS